MTVNTITTFIIGIIFLIIGFFACKSYRWKRVKGFIPLAVGLFMIYISTIGPLSKSKRKIDEVIKIESGKVASIIIQPSRINTGKNNNLVSKDTSLTDKKLIQDLCRLLNNAATVGDDFLKGAVSICRVKIIMINEQAIVFGVKREKQSTCLIIDSNGETGWHYANLEANEFGLLLNRIFSLSR